MFDATSTIVYKVEYQYQVEGESIWYNGEENILSGHDAILAVAEVREDTLKTDVMHTCLDEESGKMVAEPRKVTGFMLRQVTILCEVGIIAKSIAKGGHHG